MHANCNPTVICEIGPLSRDEWEAVWAPDDVKLQGTWKAVGGEEKGITLTQKDLENEPVTLVFSEDRLTMTWGNEKESFNIRLNPDGKPPAMDIIYPHDKGINHAIYSLSEGKLTICFSKKLNPNSPEERPVRFTTKRDQNKDLRGLVMFEFRKEK
jgi:uncharacterized protein (TIGR03067 family)